MNLRLAGILGFIGFGAMLVSTHLVQAETLAISCGAVGQELEFCKTGNNGADPTVDRLSQLRPFMDTLQ